MRMRAYRANFRSFLANYDMAAVGALPYSVAVLGEYQIAFYVSKKFLVSFFVFLFDSCNAFEKCCDFIKTFKQQQTAKTTNGRICTQALLKLQEKKVLSRLLSCLKA